MDGIDYPFCSHSTDQSYLINCCSGIWYLQVYIFHYSGGHPSVVQYLVKEANCVPNVEDKYGKTPLHKACRWVHTVPHSFLSNLKYCMYTRVQCVNINNGPTLISNYVSYFLWVLVTMSLLPYYYVSHYVLTNISCSWDWMPHRICWHSCDISLRATGPRVIRHNWASMSCVPQGMYTA